MLDKIREGASGIIAKVILGLVILSFVFAGVGSYLNSGSEIPAATVNGEDISSNTLERAYQSERARMESQLGEAFSQLASNEDYLANFRQSILDKLISDKLLDQKAEELGLRVSDEQVKDAIFSIPAFQVDGVFNNDRFQTLIRQSGFKVTDFRDNLRMELTRQQLSQILLGTDFTLDSEARHSLQLQKQTRDARFVAVSMDEFAKNVSISDEERNQYYKSNIANFETEEMVKVAYVDLKISDLMEKVEVTDADVNTFYQEHMDNYQTPEERRASHILIEFGDNEDAALAKAQDLLNIANTGADFAALARDNSADAFSAENGGDLEWFGRDVMDPAFEEATFGLQNVGDISEVVKSEFGFHIIKLTDIKPVQVKEFDEVKDEIAQTLKHDKAAELFYEYQTQMSELAFEVQDSLQDVATVANLEVKTSDLFSRSTAPADLANLTVLDTVFSADFIAERINSDALSVSDDHLMFVRVTDHQDARTKSLEEVTADIDAELTRQKAVAAAKEWMIALKDSVANGDDVTAKLAEHSLEWQVQAGVGRYSGAMDSQLRTELFKLSVTDSRKIVEMANGDVALLELQKVNPVDTLDNNEVKAVAQRLAMRKGQDNFSNVLAVLKEQADIEYKRAQAAN
ncbi:SurA N-terminal domain-containing protein [Paraneptunicella aestuarii]|uniref:SurA N-terminal domain-containing protein n=1 Tax=Paraneptunicella aestuarii TaxID=2831148 RepID=UPI001E31EF88|nr:SurA N-terminal domain-containing protein [Paraneptunicella aestuarii]UAA37795.1 SurA N-terminal domain-containing protein [Paraneptunicella aestuarii]